MRLGPLLPAGKLALVTALACFMVARADPVMPVLHPVDFNSPTSLPPVINALGPRPAAAQIVGNELPCPTVPSEGE